MRTAPQEYAQQVSHTRGRLHLCEEVSALGVRRAVRELDDSGLHVLEDECVTHEDVLGTLEVAATLHDVDRAGVIFHDRRGADEVVTEVLDQLSKPSNVGR